MLGLIALFKHNFIRMGMLRHWVLFVNFIPLIFLFNSTELKKEELKIDLTAPASAKIGDQFEVELKITGGKIKGFAKYIDKLPAGCTAEAVEMGKASFTADNGQIKILWVQFPDEDEVVLKYKVSVGESAPAILNLGGKFSYLEGGEKVMFSVMKKAVKISSESGQQIAQKQEETVPVSVSVTRKVVNSRENVHQIELTVNQTGIAGFGKIQEFIPLGAAVEEAEGKNASFSHIKNKVKFVWMSLPKEETFKVSYYIDLTDADNKDINSITGNFSYLDNDVTKKVDIQFGSAPALAKAESKPEEQNSSETSSENASNTEESAADNSNNETNNNGSAVNSGEEKIAVVTAPVPVGGANNEKEESSTEQENSSNLVEPEVTEPGVEEEVALATEEKEEVEEAVVEETPKEDVIEENPVAEVFETNEEELNSDKEEEVEPVTAKVEEKPEPIKESTPPVVENIPQVVDGVEYRVQVAAGKNVVDAAYFKKNHQFEQAFNIENHQGWVKYTTGSYKVYRDARDSRESINSAGHKFDGPFVTAYNSGTRITVQEALMITSQKWFK